MTKVKRGVAKAPPKSARKGAAKAAPKTAERKAPRPKSPKARAVATKRPVRKKAVRATSKQGKKGKVKVVVPVPRTVKIRELDPQQRCGPGTSVQHMFRVDETLGGRLAAVHLVFFDRHGLYCEHGRGCPAVEDVRKSHRQLDRMTQGGMRA